MHNEVNVFKGFWDNWMFYGVIFATIVVQILIIEFGSTAFKVVVLSTRLWLISVVCQSYLSPILQN